MNAVAPLLEVDSLRTQFTVEGGVVHAVDGISFVLAPGETVALVGESGSGKTATALSIMGLIDPPGEIVGGDVRLDGRSLVGLPEGEYRRVRGRDIAMVFQEPMTSLNPVMRVGDQIAEALLVHATVPTRRAARARAVELMELVGLAGARSRMRDHPHLLSGGMRQRVMIAMALANTPRVLIADEPTTALDVTTQAQVLEVLQQVQREMGLALLLVTHDLGIVAGLADRVLVMYAGRVVEEGLVDDVYGRSRHPYTLGLLESVPRCDGERRTLVPIPGSPPSLLELPEACSFHPRCSFADARCRAEQPELREVGARHRSACHYAEELGRVVWSA